MVARSLALVVALLTSLPCTFAQSAGAVKKLPITADLGICAHRDEQAFNTGGQSQVRVKGIEHYYLFNFDANALTGFEITRATLNLKVSRGKFRRAGICTVPAAWVEGSASGKSQNGSTCYTHLKYPDVPWTVWGGTMLDATFNSPYMFWRASDVQPQNDGWVKIDVDPRLVQAVAAGLSHGLVLSDERGQARENIDIYTRKQSNARPFMEVECRPAAAPTSAVRPAPTVRPYLPAADFKTGAVRIDTTIPGKQTLGSVVEWQCPGQPAERMVTLGDPELTIANLPPDADCMLIVTTWLDNNRSSRNRVAAHSSPALAVPTIPQITPPDTDPENNIMAQRHAPTILIAPNSQPLDKPIPWRTIFTPRNAWASVQLAIFPDTGMDSLAVTVSLERFANSRDDANGWPVQMFRAWYVPKDGRWIADPLVPLKLTPKVNPDTGAHTLASEEFAIPFKENKIPGQTCQSVLIDIWVPKSARPGRAGATLKVQQGEKILLAEPVFLNVSA